MYKIETNFEPKGKCLNIVSCSFAGFLLKVNRKVWRRWAKI